MNMKRVFGGMVGIGVGLLLVADVWASGYSVRGLHGQNDPASSAYRYTFSADLAEFWNPLDSSGLTTSPVPLMLCDTGFQGRGGRDQTEPFPATGWIHFYLTRSTGNAPACVLSLTMPPVGPTLQGGDTHWAYIGAVRLSGGGFTPIRMLGSKMNHEEFVNILSNGPSTMWATVDISNYVPPNALEWEGQYSLYLTASPPSDPYPGTLSFTLFTGYLSNKVHGSIFEVLNGLNPSVAQVLEGYIRSVPNWDQKFYYKWEIYAGTGPQFSVDLYNYRVPNGGE